MYCRGGRRLNNNGQIASNQISDYFKESNQQKKSKMYRNQEFACLEGFAGAVGDHSCYGLTATGAVLTEAYMEDVVLEAVMCKTDVDDNFYF